MMSRRDALKSLALTAGAAAWAHTPLLASSLTGAGPRPPAGRRHAHRGDATRGAHRSVHAPPLPYAPDALEPHLDAQTMTIHHDKHHAAYGTT